MKNTDQFTISNGTKEIFACALVDPKDPTKTLDVIGFFTDDIGGDSNIQMIDYLYGAGLMTTEEITDHLHKLAEKYLK